MNNKSMKEYIMLIACLGDSLTEGDYGVFGKSGITNVRKENYPYFLAKYMNAEVGNFGKCGYRANDYLHFYQEGNVNTKDADFIIIMLGTNGGQSACEETTDNMSYMKLLDLCKNDAPNARIVLCTPPHATYNPEYSNCGYAKQVEEAVLFVRKVAAENDIYLIDVAKCPYFTEETESIMQSNDGLHFNEAGYEALAKFISDHLKALLTE